VAEPAFPNDRGRVVVWISNQSVRAFDADGATIRLHALVMIGRQAHWMVVRRGEVLCDCVNFGAGEGR